MSANQVMAPPKEQSNGTHANTPTLLTFDGKFTPEQVELVKRTICKDATNDELSLFLSICERTQLNPLTKQIYFIKRWDTDAGMKVGTVQIAIDGFRLVANRTKQYGGKVSTQWCGPDGEWKDVWLAQEPPAAAKVVIIRKDFAQPLTAVAVFKEFAQRAKDGSLLKFWRTMPSNQIAKCAEALALRQAFPNELSGLYTEDECEVVKVVPEAIDADVLDLHKETNNDLASEGQLTIPQRKKVREWMRAYVQQENIGFLDLVVAARDDNDQDAQNSLDEIAEKCLNEYGWEVTDQHLDDVTNTAEADFKETNRRRSASAANKEARDAKKGNGVATVTTTTVVDTPATEPPAGEPEPPKPQAAPTRARTRGASTANVATQDSSPAVNAPPATTSAPEPPKPAASVGAGTPEAQSAPAKGSATGRRGAGAANAARQAESAPAANPQELLETFLKHCENDPKEAPDVKVEGAMIKAIAEANGWHNLCRGEVMLTEFGIDAKTIKEGAFTWDACMNMGEYFATEKQPEGLLDQIQARKGA